MSNELENEDFNGTEEIEGEFGAVEPEGDAGELENEELDTEGGEQGPGTQAVKSSDEQDPPPQVKNSRAAERIRRQQEELHRERARANAAEEERLRLVRQIDEQRQQQNQQQQQQMLDSLDPTERQNYLMQQQIESNRREMAAMQANHVDMVDKMTFQQKTMGNPIASRYTDKVEETLANMRRNGQTAPREAILKFLVGEDALSKAPAAKAKALAGNKSASTRPIRTRGNAASSGKDDDADLEERLSKLYI